MWICHHADSGNDHLGNGIGVDGRIGRVFHLAARGRVGRTFGFRFALAFRLRGKLRGRLRTVEGRDETDDDGTDAENVGAS